MKGVITMEPKQDDRGTAITSEPSSANEVAIEEPIPSLWDKQRWAESIVKE